MIPLLLLVLATSMPSELARFRAEPRLAAPAAKPDVSSGRARRYRTVLRQAAAEGPNFNGHYRVATWGCGTNCIEWAVIDLATGRVWMAPEPVTSCWFPSAPDDAKERDWMEHHTGSSLLYVHRCEGDGQSTFDRRMVYVWRDGEPRLLRTDHLDD